MNAQDVSTASAAGLGKAAHVTLWTLQVLLAVFFLVAAAGPKLFGEATAVQMFGDIGVGQWFRYFVGVVELAGAVGLVIARLSGLAALGLSTVMLGAIVTNLFVIDGGLVTITPTILLALCGLIAWGRRAQTKQLLDGLRR